MKKCIKCHIKKHDTEYYVRYYGELDNTCKECWQKYRKEHYIKNIDKYKKKAIKSRKLIHKRNTEYVWEYLSTHPCLDCGEMDPIVLEFDHLRDKINDVTGLINGSLEKLIKEIKKCDVVCGNCHKRRTAKRIGSWKTKIMFPDTMSID